MTLLQKILLGLVAIEHIYFLVLEMFLWATPKGLKVFGMSMEQAKATAALAANQGLYNGFLAAGLIWAIVHPDASTGRQLGLFFSACVLVAALYGGYSVSAKILIAQGVPALLTLLALVLLS